MKPLTKKQKSILDFIKSHLEENGYAPSFREIGTQFSLKSTATIHQHVHALKQKGYLKIEPRSARAVELEPAMMNLAHALLLPLAGIIAAGEPIEAVETKELIAVPKDLVVDGQQAYVLRVKGESMIEDGILDGDFVVVERNFYPQNGDVVVALLDNTYATLKRFYREANRIRLQPANKAMEPIYVENPAIQGIVRAVIRSFRHAPLLS